MTRGRAGDRHRHGKASVPGRLRAGLGRRDRERRLQPPGPGRAVCAARESSSCAPMPSTCARPASRSARPTWRTRWPRTPTIARQLVELFLAGLRPGNPARRRDARPRACASRSSTRSTTVTNPDEDRILRRFLNLIEADAAHQLLPARRRRRAEALPLVQARLASRSPSCRCRGRCSRSSSTPAGRRRASARRQGRARRHPLVRPARGFPHRDPRPDEGADGQERGHRAGRLEGRLRASSTRRRRGRREAFQAEGIECYKTLMRGMLDITDNLRRRRRSCRRATSCAATTTIRIWSSPPTRARRRSPTSPTRSRAEYGFWLGDAFASGGSAGYDHKEMGITARGAWEAVKRHFRELGRRHPERGLHRASASATCRATCSATACCCRAHIKLLGAFNHPHIFVDPDPDPAASFAERAAAVRPAALELDRLRPGADLAGRRASSSAAPSRSRCRRRSSALLRHRRRTA